MNGNIYLTRLKESEKETEGFLTVVDSRPIFSCYTLELPWKDNKANISRIPPGIYKWKKVYSSAFGTEVILLLGVPGRTMIEIHYGSFFKNTHGCILVGDERGDINYDGYRDVFNTKKTLKSLINHLPNEGTIYINEIFKSVNDVL